MEVRVVALQGKNYVYLIKSLYLPINSDGCHVAASKTKKNVLITLQARCCSSFAVTIPSASLPSLHSFLVLLAGPCCS